MPYSPLRRTILSAALVGPGLLAAASAQGKEVQNDQKFKCDIGKMSAVPARRLKSLSKGINISRWISPPSSEARERPTEETLKRLRDQGFTHVRLPVAAEFLAEPNGNSKFAEDRLRELGQAIADLRRLGFTVSIDMHPGHAFRNLHIEQPNKAKKVLVTAWKTLASRYANSSPDEVFFELLNEPAVAQSIWHDQARTLIKAIRAHAPCHTLIYGPANFQQIHMLKKVVPFEDRNILYAVHSYDPFVFTHQGADWIKDKPWLRYIRDLPFPATLDNKRVKGLLAELERHNHPDPVNAKKAADEIRRSLKNGWTVARINNLFAKAQQWARKHGRPVIVNEFGVYRKYTRPEDRKKWLEAVGAASKACCIGSVRWELTQGFGL